MGERTASEDTAHAAPALKGETGRLELLEMDGCIYNPVGVQCTRWKTEENPCRDCGWNQKVAERRLKEAIKKKMEETLVYINVAFEMGDKKTFSSVTHIYKCNIPVRAGDLVKAPTAHGEVLARVESIGIDFDKIDPLFRDDYRMITEKVKK